MSYEWQRFSEKRWDKVRYMRSPCNDIFYTVIHWNSVCIMHGRGLPIFWKVYMYIYWIFCDFIALRYQTWFISFDQDFHEYYEKAHILLIIIHIILVGLLLTLAFFFHHTTSDRQDEPDQAPDSQEVRRRSAVF